MEAIILKGKSNSENASEKISRRTICAAIGRFNSVDALWELAPEINPYQFGFNNPVYWSDPSGLFPSITAAREFMERQGIGSDLYYISPDGNGGFTIRYQEMTIYDAEAESLSGGIMLQQLKL